MHPTLSTAIILGAAVAAHAQTPAPAGAPAPVTLPDVVVTPTRSAQSPDALPFVTERLDAGRIQLRQLSRTTPEALKDLPSVMIQKTANGQGSPFIRGLTGYHTLFLVDGIRLNNSTFRSGPNQYWSTIDSYAIDRLEVVKGPASVQYGSDAVGGVAQAVSADPFALAGADGLFGRATARYASAERSVMGRIEGAVASGDFAARAGVSLKDFGDIESGGDAGKLPKTGYDEWAGDVGVALRLNDHWRLDAVHQQLEQDDVWRTHSTSFAKSYSGSKVGSDLARVLDQERRLTYARLSGSNLPGALRDASATASWHEQGETEFRQRKDTTQQFQGTDVDTLGLQSQASLDAAGTVLTLGVDYYHDEVDSFSRRQKEAGGAFKNGIQGPVADDSSADSLGLFLQDEFALTGSLRAVAGARYTWTRVEAGRFENPATKKADSFTDEWDNVSLMGRLIGDLTPGATAFAGVAQGFRAPNLSDLTRFDVARSGEVEIPTTGLDPEDFLTYEAGVRGHGGALRGEAAYFYTDIHDLIQRTPTGASNADGALVSKTNSGEGYVQGVELALEADVGKAVTLRGDVTWMEGELDAYATSDRVLTTEPLSRVMPVTAHLGARWQATDKVWLEGLVTIAAEQDKLSAGDKADTERIPPGGSPGYEIFTVRGGVELAKNLSLTLAVENISDEEYRVHGSGVNEPGRNFVAAVDARF